MSLASSAAAYYALIAALSERSRKRARAIWDELDRQQVTASWDAVARDALLTEVSMAQRMAAVAASRFMGNALNEQGADWIGELVNPLAISGVASDGRDLDSLLFQPAISTMRRLKDFVQVDEAFLMGAAELDAIVGTQVTDASRAAMQVEMASQPAVTGYVRMLTPPSCGRCAILAGRFYRFSDGFLRHPQCFPAGTVVSGPATEAATRRWYDGELVSLTTASGQQLSLTGNHPVLTGRGWLPAHLLNEGDEVFRSARAEGAPPLVVPDHHQMPSRIEDVWDALRVFGLRRVPASPEDFHGDGQGGEVHVVDADRALRGRLDSSLAKHLLQTRLASRADDSCALKVQRPALFAQHGLPLAAHSLMSGSRLLSPLARRHLPSAHNAGFAHRAPRDLERRQALGDGSSAHAVLLRDGVLASPRGVGTRDLLVRQHPVTPRWDAPGDAFTVKSRERYAARGLDLLRRFAGEVEPDRVVELRRSQWSGHVYSLTSSEGWHVANQLIVSNCDCVHIPSAEDAADDLRTDPSAYFESLSASEQDKYFGKGSAEAIRQGADMNQVVNARRKSAGMSRVGAIETTTEGTTRRGVAGRRLILAEGGDPTQRGAAPKSPRLTPDAILRIADGDKAQSAALFERYGYVL